MVISEAILVKEEEVDEQDERLLEWYVHNTLQLTETMKPMEAAQSLMHSVTFAINELTYW